MISSFCYAPLYKDILYDARHQAKMPGSMVIGLK